MEEIIEETTEVEIDDMTEEEDFESTNIAKWAWVAIGAAAVAGVGGLVMFVKNKLFRKKETEIPEESEEIEIEEEIEIDED